MIQITLWIQQIFKKKFSITALRSQCWRYWGLGGLPSPNDFLIIIVIIIIGSIVFSIYVCFADRKLEFSHFFAWIHTKKWEIASFTLEESLFALIKYKSVEELSLS